MFSFRQRTSKKPLLTTMPIIIKIVLHLCLVCPSGHLSGRTWVVAALASWGIACLNIYCKFLPIEPASRPSLYLN